MGIQNSFTIVDRNLGPTATITAPPAIAEDSGQPLKISLVLNNVAQASGTVTMSFAAASSTVTNGTDVSVPDTTYSYSISQSPAGSYTLELPSIAIIADSLAEGTETIAVTIRASGQIFDTGTDTKTVTVRLIDSGQTGGAGNDKLTGTRFADDLTGGAGNDTLTGGVGNDRIDGGSGSDTAVFDGLWRQSVLARDGAGGVTVTGPNGIDTLKSVESLAFNDGHFVLDVDSAGAQIMRLYNAVLGRAPDANGLDFYLDMVEDRGGTMAGVAADLVGSGEFLRATGGLDNAGFVDYLYQHTLGRAPDAGGKAFYTQRLDNGQSRASFVLEMSESAEHRAVTATMTGAGYFNTDDQYQAIALLYDGFAGRLPDAGGLAFYGERVKSGQMTLAQVAADFAGSAEFRATIAGKDNGQIVDFIYQNTLDRAPDSGGRAFYVDQLMQGASAAGVLLDVALSAEHYSLFSAHIVAGIDFL